MNDLFVKNSTGIVTMGDGFIVAESKDVLAQRIMSFLAEEVTEDVLKKQYGLGKNYASWIISNKKSVLFDEDKLVRFSYRPFDDRFTYFDNKLIWRPRTGVMSNLIKDNLALVTARSNKNPIPDHFFIAKCITEAKLGESSTQSATFPLYIHYPDGTKIPNFKNEILQKIKEGIEGPIEPEDVLDYIYAVLHAPSYRQKYKEFLKTDFPYVPYPKNERTFRALVAKGTELRGLHLMESVKLQNFVTTFPESGSDIVERIVYEDGKVFINETQYFGGVPEVAWNFYIGGYQPAQKWLKDRKGKRLANADMEHYQKMIVVLLETEEIMKEIGGIFKD